MIGPSEIKIVAILHLLTLPPMTHHEIVEAFTQCNNGTPVVTQNSQHKIVKVECKR